jgi:hypothetical protein
VQLASMLALGTRTKIKPTTMRQYIWSVETNRATPKQALAVLRALSKRFPVQFGQGSEAPRRSRPAPVVKKSHEALKEPRHESRETL